MIKYSEFDGSEKYEVRESKPWNGSLIWSWAITIMLIGWGIALVAIAPGVAKLLLALCVIGYINLVWLTYLLC